MSTALTEARPAPRSRAVEGLRGLVAGLPARADALPGAVASAAAEGGRWPAFDERALEKRLERLRRSPDGAEPAVARAVLAEEAAVHDHRLRSCFDEHRAAYGARLYRRDAVADIAEARDRALAAVRAEAEERRGEIDRARDEARRREDDLEDFRKTEGIEREAQYPEHRVRHCLVAAGAAALETVGNAALLAGGAAGGLIEAWGVAATIAVVNIGGAFFGGNLARYANHRSPLAKGFGALAVIGCGLGLFFFNLFVGHFRQAMGAADYSNAAAAGSLAWDTFTANYLGIADFRSWVFAVIGMLFAGIAFWKGYSMEDPYPGYSRRTRKFLETREAFDEARVEAMEALDEAREDGARDIRSAVENHRSGLAGDEQARGGFAALADELERERSILERKIERSRLTCCPELDPVRLEPLPAPAPLPETEAASPAEVQTAAERARGALSEAVRQAGDSFESGQRS